jgi:hypothetical protein
MVRNGETWSLSFHAVDIFSCQRMNFRLWRETFQLVYFIYVSEGDLWKEIPPVSICGITCMFFTIKSSPLAYFYEFTSTFKTAFMMNLNVI